MGVGQIEKQGLKESRREAGSGTGGGGGGQGPWKAGKPGKARLIDTRSQLTVHSKGIMVFPDQPTMFLTRMSRGP